MKFQSFVNFWGTLKLKHHLAGQMFLLYFWQMVCLRFHCIKIKAYLLVLTRYSYKSSHI